MITQILQDREVTWTKRHDIFFAFPGHEGSWGFGFDCDAQGQVNLAALRPEARANYLQCRTGSVWNLSATTDALGFITWDAVPQPVLAGHRRSWDEKHVQERVGRCECGGTVMLSRFTNTCECGRDYNSAGTELAPRHFWGEETGEHHADIARL